MAPTSIRQMHAHAYACPKSARVPQRIRPAADIVVDHTHFDAGSDFQSHMHTGLFSAGFSSKKSFVELKLHSVCAVEELEREGLDAGKLGGESSDCQPVVQH